MVKTKKVGISGKFGPRYGAVVRTKWRRIAEVQKGVHKCPKCKSSVKNMRTSVGLWECSKCGAKFSGGAWAPATKPGQQSYRTTTRLAKELAEITKNE